MIKKLLISLCAVIFLSSFLSYSQNISCGSNFYDPAGPTANYANNANVTTVISPTNSGDQVTVTFSAFQLENNYDFLRVYNGLNANAPLLAIFTGSTLPYAITASNANGTLTFVFTSDSSLTFSGWSATVSCSPMPAVTCPTPNQLIASTASNAEVFFSWNEVGTASNWEVYIAPCGTSPTAATSGVGTQNNQYIINGLNSGSCYTLFVRSICGLNEVSEWSSGIEITVGGCEAPVQLSATQITSNSATLNWTNPLIYSSSEIVYQLANSGIPNSNITYVASNSSFVATNLLPSTTYEFYVRTSCEINSISNWSGPFLFTTQIAPASCGGMFYDNGGSASNYLGSSDVTTTICPSTNGEYVTVTFTSFSTENSYDGLYVYDGNSISSPQIASSNGSGSIPGGVPGSFWGTTIPGPFTSSSSDGCLTFRFRSDSTVNNPGWAASVSCDVISNCLKPTAIQIIPTSYTDAVGTWNQQGTGIQWELELTGNGSTTTFISTTNSYNFTNLVAGQTYILNIRTTCSIDNQSNWATFIFTMPNCVVPSSVYVSEIAPNEAKFSWNSFGVSSEYIVLLLPAGSPFPNDSATGVLAPSNIYFAQGLTPNTSYDVYVKSICLFDTFSNWSEVSNFTTPQFLFPLQSTTTQFTPQQLVNVVLGNNPCISVSNVTTTTGTNFGSTNGIGYFTNTNPTFPMSSGMVLSTGNAGNLAGPNTTTLSEGTSNWVGDSDLENIITAATGAVMNSQNATKLEFDFTTINEFMSFNFLFASEEYGTFQCDFSDAFAFLLTDLITGVTTNIAVVPGTTTPISVVTIRDNEFNASCSSVNEGYFNGYNTTFSSATNFNGQTTLLTASSALMPNHPYHIKLVIADRQDTAFDSAVFIQAGTFTSGPPQCNDKIQLSAFVDSNGNGIKDSNENDFSYGSFTVEQNNSGVVNNISSPIGTYVVFDSNPSNVYDFGFSVDSEYLPYYTSGAINYNDVSIALGSGTQTFYFPVTLVQGYNDVTVLITPVVPPRPGFSYTNKIVYKNLGINATSGTLNFVADPNVTVGEISQPGIVTNSTGFSYNFDALQPFESRFIYVTMNVPSIPTVNLDDILTNSASISASFNDIDLNNNNFTNSEIVVAAYDPNDITESHGAKILHSQFSDVNYLYYTIRFQNTGTANAINVRLENVLDSQLNAASIRIVSASHDYILERIGNQLVFKFNYINLVGALQDDELSKGYVTYKIKVNSGFEVGDIIPNIASIFFDSNPAIVTNTFTTEFVSSLATNAFSAETFLMYPNPANSFVKISLQNSTENLERVSIIDVLGKTIRNSDNIRSNQVIISTDGLAKGMYLVEITSENNLQSTKKLIVN